MKEIVKWQTTTGKKVEVTVELILTETIWADGDSIDVKCCKIDIIANVEGLGCVGTGSPNKHGAMSPAVARIGKLGLVEDNYQRVMTAISKIKSTPEWQAKIATEEKNEQEYQENHKRRIANGWCPKCESYCHGDCQS